MFENEKKGLLDGTNPKVSFLLGLFIGISVISIIALVAVLAKGSDNLAFAEADSENKKIEEAAEAPPTQPVEEPQVADVPAVSNADYIRGNKNASVTIIEYSDFQCPFCSRFHETMLQVMEEYGDQVRWVYRHFPLTSLHPEAQSAAEAYECAAEQGKYAAYADALIENQDNLGDDLYSKLAGDLGLNTSQFEECLSSGKYKNKVSSQAKAGASAGVRGTPATFINGEMVSGAVPYSSLKQIIDSKL